MWLVYYMGHESVLRITMINVLIKAIHLKVLHEDYVEGEQGTECLR